MTPLQKLATEYLKQFEQIEKKIEGEDKTDKKYIWIRKATAPEELNELAQKIHGGMFPDDYKYEYIVEAFNSLSENEDPDNIQIETDVYNYGLVEWLHSHLHRGQYVNAAVNEFGTDSKDFDIYQTIAQGQYFEKSEVLGMVRNWLESKLEKEESK